MFNMMSLYERNVGLRNKLNWLKCIGIVVRVKICDYLDTGLFISAPFRQRNINI